MATLEELREKLDGIDDQITKLYEERMKSARMLEDLKSAQGEKCLTVKENMKNFWMWHPR